MITLLLFALASGAGASSPPLPCVPVASDRLTVAPSAIEDHKALRKAIGEPMPEAPTMVMMYGAGGHLSTQQYSVVLSRGADNVWHGTAVGRSQIWIADAPYTPMKRIEWVLNKDQAQQLDHAISRRCPLDRSAASEAKSGPPPLGYIVRRIDVIRPGQNTITYFASDGDGKIASLLQPPQ